MHVVEELLLNIVRACRNGRNVADMEKDANFVATCDHIEDLADQALLAIPTPAQPRREVTDAEVRKAYTTFCAVSPFDAMTNMRAALESFANGGDGNG